jgi:hypothetical protein
VLGIAGSGENDIDALLMPAKSIGRFRQRQRVGLLEKKAERISRVERIFGDGALGDQLGT